MMKVLLSVAAAAALAACAGDSSCLLCTSQRESMILTIAQKKSLDSTGDVIKAANPGNATLQSLVDSTLQVLSAGIEARHLDVTTDFGMPRLYFVSVHRAVRQSTSGSFSTWTIIGFDDPSHLTFLMEWSGFAQNGTSTPPASLSDVIGSTYVNGLMLNVASGGGVTMYTATSGNASFVSSASGGACPNFTPTTIVTCSLETTATHMTMTAGTKTASLTSDWNVPGIRLFYTP